MLFSSRSPNWFWSITWLLLVLLFFSAATSDQHSWLDRKIHATGGNNPAISTTLAGNRTAGTLTGAPKIGPVPTGLLPVFVNLTGWWAVVEDNGRLIKMQHQDGNVTILDAYGSLLGSGRFANDTLLIYFSPTDTLVFVYAADTLRGHNEVGDPLTFARFLVDLSGWWRQLESGDVFKILQQDIIVSLWEGVDSNFIADGTFVDDTLLLILPPVKSGTDTLTLAYAADTLRGLGPEGNAVSLVRSPQGPWAAIRYGTITVDGDTSDWPEEFLIAHDPGDDGRGSSWAELDKLYLCFDCTYLHIRIDCVGAVAFPDYNDRYSVFLGRQIHGSYDYQIRFWNFTPGINFRNCTTGQETTLEPPGIRGHTIEGRIPLTLLENMEQAEINTRSEYYNPDSGWAAYDQIEVYAQRHPVKMGDMDTSGNLGLNDVVLLLNCVFLTTGDCGLCLADVNCSADLSPADVVLELNAVYLGAAFPC